MCQYWCINHDKLAYQHKILIIGKSECGIYQHLLWNFSVNLSWFKIKNLFEKKFNTQNCAPKYKAACLFTGSDDQPGLRMTQKERTPMYSEMWILFILIILMLYINKKI